MAGVKVMLAMPTHRDLPPQTAISLLQTQDALRQRNISSDIEIQIGGSLPHHARTKLAWHFLQSDCTHLFWLDSDMTWKADDFLRILSFGTKLECVGAAYPCRGDPPRFFLAGMPTDVEANEFGCIPVRGMGLGFTCVQRIVIEKIAASAQKLIYPDIQDGETPVPELFHCEGKNGYARGEDIAFFDDAKDHGFQLYVDPSIELGHMGAKEYRAKLLDHLVKA